MRKNTMNRAQFRAAAAAAMSTLGLLAVPVVAQANPMFPLAPACDYEFPMMLIINQDNGTIVHVPVSGSPRRSVGPGKAMHAIPGRTEATVGSVYGGMNGLNINFTAHWDAGPGKDSSNTYTGRINPDGFATGTTTSNINITVGWRSGDKMSCVFKSPAPAAPPAAPAPPSPPMATVTGDVDIYDAPGGEGNVTGVLPAGRQVQTKGTCSPDDWCEIPGTGWVWGEFLKY